MYAKTTVPATAQSTFSATSLASIDIPTETNALVAAIRRRTKPSC